jgi:protein O-GlcNAc transferase
MELALGQVYFSNGQYAEAITAFREYLLANPQSAEAYFHLGNALWRSGDAKAAIVAQRNSLRFQQTSSALNSLGLALIAAGEIDEAIGAFKKALDLQPNQTEALVNLGNAQQSVGRVDDAMISFTSAVVAGNRGLASEAFLFTMHYSPSVDLSALAKSHRAWGDRLDATIRHLTPSEDRSDRPLHVGLVSADFNAHAAARFLLPLLEQIDRSKFQLYLYSNNAVADFRTAQFQQLADVWRDIRQLNDDAAAQLILQDKVDVLFDLSVHTEGNRLGVFARRPAPVQATWLGYASTTGVKTIDYRLSDPHLDPNPQEDQLYAEKTLRLADSFWCFQPFDVTPPAGPSPFASAGHVMFGSLNNFAKVNSSVQIAWADILARIPNSRIIVHSPRGSHRGELRKCFLAKGVDSSRIEFVEFLPTQDYLALHNRIDIALDPFPFAGGTTTCDALWMGVPVVTLSGAIPVSRGGASILRNVGLPELIGQTREEYAQIVIDLARDPARLAQYHATLRDRVSKSPLTDAPRFARNFESAIRHMWLGQSE